MSRTYRCRSLPLPGKRTSVRAYKISDGGRGYSWRRQHEEAQTQVEDEFGPRPKPDSRMVHSKELTHKRYPRWMPDMSSYMPVILKGRPMMAWEAWAWDHEVERVEKRAILPICAWHPYQQKPFAGFRKKWERVSANRGDRRCTHQLLRSQSIDEDWDGHFPGRQDRFNWWDIY